MKSGEGNNQQTRALVKTILPEEQPVIDFAYATVVTTKFVRKGDTFNYGNTWVKRPGTGPIPAKDLDKVLHKIAANDLAANVHIKPEDVLKFESVSTPCEK